MNARPNNLSAARDAANPFGRELPSQSENEQNLLGAIMLDDSVLDNLPPEFSEHHFEEKLHGEIFREMKRIKGEGRRLSPVTIKTAMPTAPEKIGALTFGHYLSAMLRETVGLGAVPGLVEAVMDGENRRRLIYLGARLHDIAFAHETSIDDEAKACEAELASIREERAGEKGKVTAGDAYIRMFEASSTKNGLVGVPIALPEISTVLSEPLLEAGNLYGLLSSSGEGKSSLTMQIIYHAIKTGHPVLFLSYDQSPEQCVRQMIAQNLGIAVKRQREPTRFLSRAEQDQCLDFAMAMNRQPIQIIRCQREGVERLIAYGRHFLKHHANGKTPLIVIDHIGKVKPRDPKLSADRISGDVTVELKAFADESAAAVIVLNQRNSEGTKRDNPRPIARDLYGGEGAKADYDAILYLYRPEKYREERVAVAASDQDWKRINRVFGEEEQWKDVAELGVIKSRFGNPNLKETVRFEPNLTRYVSTRRAAQEELI